MRFSDGAGFPVPSRVIFIASLSCRPRATQARRLGFDGELYQTFRPSRQDQSYHNELWAAEQHGRRMGIDAEDNGCADTRAGNGNVPCGFLIPVVRMIGVPDSTFRATRPSSK